MLEISIDEAGRGPLAGPVWVGLILPLRSFDYHGFDDSKALSEKQRKAGYEKILGLEYSGDILFASGHASNLEIDRNGIIRGLQWAIRRALYSLIKKHSPGLLPGGRGCYRKKICATNWKPKLIIDGNHTFGLDTYFDVETIIKGDSKSPLIGMASIIAKVERDRYMLAQAKIHPDYGFERHKGYGTRYHRNMILDHGLSRLHRKGFCTNIHGNTPLAP